MIQPQEMERALEADGWKVTRAPIAGYRGDWPHARKRIAGIAPAGAFSPDGGRVVTLRIDPIGALERVGPWGEVEGFARLWDETDPAQAIARALSAE